MDHADWVYQRAQPGAPVGTFLHIYVSTARQRLRRVREVGSAFVAVRAHAPQALTQQELQLIREMELRQNGAVHSAVETLTEEANAALRR